MLFLVIALTWLVASWNFQVHNALLGVLMAFAVERTWRRFFWVGHMGLKGIGATGRKSEFRLLPFLAFYLTELIRSSVNVSLMALGLKASRPRIARLRMDISDRGAQVLVANLITLTPGSLTLDLREGKDQITVHLLDGSIDAEEMLRSLERTVRRAMGL